MDWLCLIGLIYLFGRCNGNFLMIYKEKEEAILLSCKRDGWQMDLDQDNTIDCYSNATKNILECENGPSKLKKVTSGFFACVYLSAEEQTPPWLFPFKPKHQVDFYIVALIEPNLTSAGTITNSVFKIPGETVHLPCNLTMPTKQSYNLFWIKTNTEMNSSCLHSYSLDYDLSSRYDFHCLIDDNLGQRLSNITSIPSESQYFSHLTIRNVTPADSGQYECVLQVSKKWKVITNITVTVDMKDIIIQTSDRTPIVPKSDENRLIVLYVMSALVLVCLLITTCVILVRKTEWLSKGSQSMGIKRNQNGEDTLNSECSPYEVGWRDEEIYSLANLPEGRDNLVSAQSEDKEAVELNPTMVNNTLYEASAHMDTETTSGLEPPYESVT
ncbi:uncharacterized protein LOC124482295 isoform X2 [Hypomesus transpacificus]|uniref:uncharacterized protein LOC124482295 isoform X2 n=1 Tax=Hypomesus transpacificus TaxID=137520 RepID=UPI001F086263|nr:uncharacterized protein LOC124482295 isoform X2 [Hypomesus transpacificus]